MHAITNAAFAGICLAMLGGCATAKTINPRHPDSPRLFSGLDRPEFYSGHQLNMAAIRHDGKALGRFYAAGIEPPRYPMLDLAPSLIADSVMTPYVLLDRAGESIEAFTDWQYEHFPALHLVCTVPAVIAMAPFVAVYQVNRYVHEQIDRRKAARRGEKERKPPRPT